MPVDLRRTAAGLALAVALVLPPAAAAQPAQPSAERLAACAACHGLDGNAPVAQFPSIAGQPRLFIETQLVLIREGLRDVPSMKPVMQGMDDAEIGALAAHFAAQKPAAPAAGTAARADTLARGRALAERALCGSCHRPDYTGQQQVPRLAGQNEPYLVQSMTQLRDAPGPGRDTIMAATLRGMSDADLAALAHYLAHFGR